MSSYSVNLSSSSSHVAKSEFKMKRSNSTGRLISITYESTKTLGVAKDILSKAYFGAQPPQKEMEAIFSVDFEDDLIGRLDLNSIEEEFEVIADFDSEGSSEDPVFGIQLEDGEFNVLTQSEARSLKDKDQLVGLGYKGRVDFKSKKIEKDFKKSVSQGKVNYSKGVNSQVAKKLQNGGYTFQTIDADAWHNQSSAFLQKQSSIKTSNVYRQVRSDTPVQTHIELSKVKATRVPSEESPLKEYSGKVFPLLGEMSEVTKELEAALVAYQDLEQKRDSVETSQQKNIEIRLKALSRVIEKERQKLERAQQDLSKSHAIKSAVWGVNATSFPQFLLKREMRALVA